MIGLLVSIIMLLVFGNISIVSGVKTKSAQQQGPTLSGPINAGIAKECKDWGIEDEAECLNECFDREVALERRIAAESAGWQIYSSVVDNPIGDIAYAVVENEHTNARLDATNCQQLMGQMLVSGQQKLLAGQQKSQQKLLEIDGRLNESLASLKAVENGISATQKKLIEGERRLTSQIHDVQRGQQAMQSKVDKILHRIRSLSMTNQQNAFSAKLTEFLACVSNIQHAFAMARGVISDLRVRTSGLEQIVHSATEGELPPSELLAASTKWNSGYEGWARNLAPLLDSTAVRALDSLGRISALVGTGGLLEDYYEERILEIIRRDLKEGHYHGMPLYKDSSEVFRYLYELRSAVARDFFSHDDLLFACTNAIIEVRSILLFVPREGYWSSLAAHSQSLGEAFAEVASVYVGDGIFQSIKLAIQIDLPAMFPPFSGCLKSLQQKYPEIDTKTVSKWQRTSAGYLVIQNPEGLIDELVGDPRKGALDRVVLYVCRAYGGVEKKRFSKSEIGEMRRLAKGMHRKDYWNHGNKSAWECRALDVAAKATSISRNRECLAYKPLSNCLKQGEVKCPRQTCQNLPQCATQKPGCYTLFPTGCPRHPQLAKDYCRANAPLFGAACDSFPTPWFRDTWGEGEQHTNAKSSSFGCLTLRRKAFNAWCGVANVQMKFIPA